MDPVALGGFISEMEKLAVSPELAGRVRALRELDSKVKRSPEKEMAALKRFTDTLKLHGKWLQSHKDSGQDFAKRYTTSKAKTLGILPKPSKKPKPPTPSPATSHHSSTSVTIPATPTPTSTPAQAEKSSRIGWKAPLAVLGGVTAVGGGIAGWRAKKRRDVEKDQREEAAWRKQKRHQ